MDSYASCVACGHTAERSEFRSEVSGDDTECPKCRSLQGVVARLHSCVRCRGRIHGPTDHWRSRCDHVLVRRWKTYAAA